MSVIDKAHVPDLHPIMTVSSRKKTALPLTNFWDDYELQKSKRRTPFLLLAVIGHLAIAALFVIVLETPERIVDEVAIEMVTPPAPPVPRQVKPPEQKPEVKEMPKPQSVQQRVIPKPAPRLDPPNPNAVAVAPVPPSPPQAAPAPQAPSQIAPPPTYIAELYAHLGRYKRYPRAAQLARIQGTVYLRFSMDRQGKVLSAKIERSSEHAALDAEVLSMIERAQPLPIPPDDMPDRIELVIPVEFFVR